MIFIFAKIWIEGIYRCGTLALASSKFTMLTTPSPNINPLARITIGVSSRCLYDFQYQFTKPPTALARVKEGTLYIPFAKLASRREYDLKIYEHLPTATAIPPGT